MKIDPLQFLISSQYSQVQQKHPQANPHAAAMQLCKLLYPPSHRHCSFWEEICPGMDPMWCFQTHWERLATCPCDESIPKKSYQLWNKITDNMKHRNREKTRQKLPKISFLHSFALVGKDKNIVEMYSLLIKKEVCNKHYL